MHAEWSGGLPWGSKLIIGNYVRVRVRVCVHACACVCACLLYMFIDILCSV